MKLPMLSFMLLLPAALGANKDRILLTSIKQLTFRPDALTHARRTDPIPQVPPLSATPPPTPTPANPTSR